FAQNTGMDPAGELGQLDLCPPKLGPRLFEHCPEGCARSLTCFVEQHSNLRQALLGALLELTLEPSSLCVARLHDPSPRRLDVLQLAPHLRLQPSVGHRYSRRSCDRVE